MHAERMGWLHDLAAQPDTGQCVDWPWTIDEDGYPHSIRIAGRMRRVSHVVLDLAGEPRPSRAHGVLHSCDRPLCLAPWHLRWGTQAENVRDMMTRDRHRPNGVNGEQHGQAKLTWGAVEQIRAAVSAGATRRSQAQLYGVSRQTIDRVVRHELWQVAQ